jgi:hypothetical protein
MNIGIYHTKHLSSRVSDADEFCGQMFLNIAFKSKQITFSIKCLKLKKDERLFHLFELKRIDLCCLRMLQLENIAICRETTIYRLLILTYLLLEISPKILKIPLKSLLWITCQDSNA